MAEETSNTKPKINPETQIVFTLKTFAGVILFMLGLFVGFHKMVILPTLENHEKTMKEIQTKSDEKFEKLNLQLIEISNGIGNINGNIEGINNRFKDLNESVHKQEGGSFSKPNP